MEAGLVSPAETEVLDQLVYRGLISVVPQRGPAYRRVVVTPAGRTALAA
jgi:DNA-binding MarR family transcriptional regulator